MARTSEKPETMGQATTWTTANNRYREVGLCLACAAQAAWGHQCGFRAINPPCEMCRDYELPEWIVERHGVRAQAWLRGHWINDHVESEGETE